MRTPFVVGFVALLTACTSATEVIEPPAILTAAVVDGLQLSLEVTPDEVAQRDTFEVRYTVINPTADTIRVVTGSSCLLMPRTVRAGASVPFAPLPFLCFDAVTTHEFPPRYEETTTIRLRAETLVWTSGGISYSPVSAGDYLVEVVFASPTHPVLRQAVRVH